MCCCGAFWLFVDFHTSDEYFPCGGGKQPAGHPYGRRFASTVGTYEAIDLTLGDVQVKVTYRDQVPKLLRKALKMDHRVPLALASRGCNFSCGRRSRDSFLSIHLQVSVTC